MGSPDSSLGSPRRFGDVRALRTQALPSHTLFGSVLERLSSAQRAALPQMDAESSQEAARLFDGPKIRARPPQELSCAQRDLLQEEHGPQLSAWRQEHRRL